jgi:uncharacterized membrane protein
MTQARVVLRWSADRSLPSVVAASTLAALVFLIGPRLADAPPTHGFLVWNLFLAWVPLLAALALDASERTHQRVLGALSLLVWLLFLPNAPYLVSDLAHMRWESTTPWLDLARFVAFAWAGCLLGIAALRVVHGVVAARAGTLAGWVVIVGGAAASGAGVALRRFGRLNSWGGLTRPVFVADETMRLSGDRQALAVAAFFTLLVLVMYIGMGASRTASPDRSERAHGPSGRL